jgi:uncharacterized membrane protein
LPSSDHPASERPVMDDVAIARALHVLGVVIWIGGVAMVTMVLLPAIRRGDLGPNRLQVFEAIERRFAWHARLASIVVGLTGFYMTQRLELWDRFRSGGFWWMHAMVCLWLLFTVVLFVAEPLVLHRWFHTRATVAPDAAFVLLHCAHWLLLGLSVITILGAVAGSQGVSLF